MAQHAMAETGSHIEDLFKSKAYITCLYAFAPQANFTHILLKKKQWVLLSFSSVGKINYNTFLYYD